MKVEISQAANPFGRAGAIELPMLKTSEITLKAGSEDTFTDAAHSYNMTAKVTNTIGQVINGESPSRSSYTTRPGEWSAAAGAPQTTCPRACPRA